MKSVLIKDSLEVQWELFVGGATDYTQIDSQGNILFFGGGGLSFGSMFTNADIAVTATSGVWVELDAAQAWTIGKQHYCAFTDPYIVATNAGTYFIQYDLTMVCSIANKHIETGIMIDNDTTDGPAHGAAGVQNEGRTHGELLQITDERVVSAHAIIQLAANKKVSIAIRNADAADPTVTVSHGCLMIIKIAGVSAA